MNDTLLVGSICLLVVIAVVAVVVWTTVSLGGRPARTPASETQRPDPAGPQPVAGIIVNPTKFTDLDRVKRQVDGVAEAHGWSTRWWETTADDPGTGQTREAVESGVDVCCPLGGDGTVRSVAAGLVGTDVSMGLLPGGTGNLLARNLDLPIDSLEDCLVTALVGDERAIDVGRLLVSPEDTQEDPKDYYFLVMAGLGFDASVMADAPEALKSHIGWGAYVVSGLKQLNGPRFEARLKVDDGRSVKRRVRSIIIGNVGRLQGGVELLPDAKADDGSLDVVLLAPKGIVGWAAVVLRILTKMRKGHHRVEHLQCHSLQIDVPGNNLQEVQLDGDPIGPARSMSASVLPGALKVRIRRETSAEGTPEISAAGGATATRPIPTVQAG